jgi:hypothetical protein
MNIDKAGREYAKWDLGVDLPGSAFDVSFDGGTVWHSMTKVGTTLSVLVGGPEAPAVFDLVVLDIGVHKAKIRVVDNPEIVIRGGGSIAVV